MRTIFLTLILIFGGCSSKAIYTLGDTSSIPVASKTLTQVIAVENISLPTYLKSSPIYIKKSPNQLEALDDAKWIGDMEKELTDALIRYLQKVQNNPDVYAYPWESIHKPLSKKISVNISSFIAYDQHVMLEGNYQINAKVAKSSANYLFSIREPILNGDSKNVVESMEKAFFTLAEEVNSKL